jgi:NAD-dependent deacetylase
MKKKKAVSADNRIRQIAMLLKKGKVACLTGAGISHESGIPTFRGKGGLWQTYDPETYGNLPGLVTVLRKEPEKFVDFIRDFYTVLLEARPNPAHLALTFLEKSGTLNACITQNIDNLHQQSGMRSVVELHGNAFRIRCQKCARLLTLEKERVKEMLQLFERNKGSRTALLKIMSRYCPRCSHCAGRFRIDIVLFGEMLPENAMQRAFEIVDDSRTLLVVGSSLVVYPAASIPAYAKERKIKIIEINQEPSALSGIADYTVFGPAGKVLPELVRAMEKSN